MKKLMLVIMLVMGVSLGLWAIGSSESSDSGDDKSVLFTGKENHLITLEDASELVTNYRATASEDAGLGGFVGKETIQRLINQEGAVGIRIYYGKDAEGGNHLVLIGTDERGNDLLHGEIAQYLMFCPPWCNDGDDVTMLSDLPIPLSSAE